MAKLGMITAVPCMIVKKARYVKYKTGYDSKVLVMTIVRC
jgi:hypothetical protein